VSREELTARLTSLSDIDVAGILGRGLNEVGQRISFDDVHAAERRLEAWEEALGPERIAVGTSVRDVRGRHGYTIAAGAFARGQQWRKKAIDWLHFAIVRDSGPDYDRWRWVGEAYLRDVAAFAAHQRHVLENVDLTGRVKRAVRAAPLKRYVVLLACARERRALVDLSLDTYPDATAHNLMRVLELTDEAERYSRSQDEQLTVREEWKSRARAAYGGDIPSALVGRARSIIQQITSYQRIVADASRKEQLAQVGLIVERLRDSLTAFQPAGAEGANGARLERLAESLGTALACND
jgi:hypothetical protein